MKIKHLMMREPKTGKFERVAKDATDPKVAEAQIDAALASGLALLDQGEEFTLLSTTRT